MKNLGRLGLERVSPNALALRTGPWLTSARPRANSLRGRASSKSERSRKGRRQDSGPWDQPKCRQAVFLDAPVLVIHTLFACKRGASKNICTLTAEPAFSPGSKNSTRGLGSHPGCSPPTRLTYLGAGSLHRLPSPRLSHGSPTALQAPRPSGDPVPTPASAARAVRETQRCYFRFQNKCLPRARAEGSRRRSSVPRKASLVSGEPRPRVLSRRVCGSESGAPRASAVCRAGTGPRRTRRAAGRGGTGVWAAGAYLEYCSGARCPRGS